MKRAWAFNSILVCCLLLFEIFSFSSSREALFGLTGMDQWSLLIAFSLCAVDFAGLGKLLIPDERLPKDSYGMLFAAWLLSAIGDTFLTYLVVSHDMSIRVSQVALVSSGVISVFTWTFTIPVFISVLVWLVQVMLVTGFERLISPSKTNLPSRLPDGLRKRFKKSPKYPI